MYIYRIFYAEKISKERRENLKASHPCKSSCTPFGRSI